MRILCACALVGCLLARVVAQVPPSDSRPSFDVASVKPNPGPVQGRSLTVGPDSLLATKYSPLSLITRAYGVTAQRIEGLPSWARTELFDIRAKAPRTASPVEIFEMVRSLLEERFKLRVHPESRVVDVYVLGVDREKYPGSGLHPISIDCATKTLDPSSAPGLFPTYPRLPCEAILRGRHKEMKKGVAWQNAYVGVTVFRFADMLEGELGRPVRDQTGIAGTFDIELNYPETVASTPTQTGFFVFTPSEAMIRDVVRDQLGLTLTAGRGQVDFLIIDSIDRPDPD